MQLSHNSLPLNKHRKYQTYGIFEQYTFERENVLGFNKH